jgi:hypothetical protein
MRHLLAAVVAVSLFAALSASGATRTWSGATSGLWSVGSNWQGGVVPSAGDDLVFDQTASASTPSTITSDLVGLSVHSVALVHTPAPAPYTLAGNTLTVGAGGIIVSPGPGGAQGATIGLPVVLSAPATFSATGAPFANSVDNAGYLLTLTGAPVTGTSINFLGPISGSGAVKVTGVAGSGAALSNAANLYTGPTAIDVATLGAYPPGSLPPTQLGFTSSGGQLDLYGSQTVGSLYGLNSASIVNFVNSGLVLTIGVDDVTVTYSGSFTGAIGKVEKVGSGTQSLGGPFGGQHFTVGTMGGTYGGTLRLTGTGAGPSDAINGTLQANALGGSLTVFQNGSVQPGTSGPAPMIVSGNATFFPGGRFVATVNGPSSYSNLNASGTIALNGATLALTVGPMVAMGDTYTILQGTVAVTGTFAGLPEAATFCAGGSTFQIHYLSNAAYLQVVTIGSDATPPTVTAPGAATVTQTACQ